jgi:hypothetical protein
MTKLGPKKGGNEEKVENVLTLQVDAIRDSKKEKNNKAIVPHISKMQKF